MFRLHLTNSAGHVDEKYEHITQINIPHFKYIFLLKEIFEEKLQNDVIAILFMNFVR